MHAGGAWAKVVVRGEEPLAAGHGVTPVIVAPAGSGGGTGGVGTAWVVGVVAAVAGAVTAVVAGAAVVGGAAAGFLVEPVVLTTIRAMRPTISTTMAPPTTMNLRRLARRCWAARSAIALAAAFSR